MLKYRAFVEGDKMGAWRLSLKQNETGEGSSIFKVAEPCVGPRAGSRAGLVLDATDRS